MAPRVLFLLLCGIALPAADWDKPFAQWPDSTVLRLLTDSPWTKQVSSGIEWTKREMRPLTYKDVPGADHNRPQDPSLGPLGGIGARKPKLPDKADLLIRWANALPLRHAKAVYLQREERQPASALNGLIDNPAGAYVVEIYGVPSEVAHQGTATVADLASRSSELHTRGGRTVKAKRATVSVQADILKILVFFPNDEPLTKADGWVEFSSDLQLLKCKARFPLGNMTYQGRLEL